MEEIVFGERWRKVSIKRSIKIKNKIKLIVIGIKLKTFIEIWQKLDCHELIFYIFILFKDHEIWT